MNATKSNTAKYEQYSDNPVKQIEKNRQVKPTGC